MRLLPAVAAITILAASCGTSPEDARGELDRLGVSYDAPAFREQLQSGDATAVSLFLTAGMDPNTVFEEDQKATPLMLAGDSVKVAEILVANGANLEATNADGMTPLLVAVQSGHHQMQQFLLERGANPNATTGDQSTALMIATQIPDAGSVRILLGHPLELNARRRTGRTALHDAADRGDIEIVRLLIDAGASLNVAGHMGETPLRTAAEAGQLDSVKLLAESGADLNNRTSRVSPLQSAAIEGHVEVVKFLAGAGAEQNWKGDAATLATLAQKGRTESLRVFIEKGANVNAAADRGTPLMYAVRAGQTETISLLLSKGANPRLKAGQGKTAFDLARQMGRGRILRLLQGGR